MKKLDLQRAGIKNAKKVVILSPTLNDIFETNITTNIGLKQMSDKAK